MEQGGIVFLKSVIAHLRGPYWLVQDLLADGRPPPELGAEVVPPPLVSHVAWIYSEFSISLSGVQGQSFVLLTFDGGLQRQSGFHQFLSPLPFVFSDKARQPFQLPPGGKMIF